MTLLFFFEVMDKEPPMWALLVLYGIVSFGGFLLAYWRWPFALLSMLIAAALTWLHLTEFHDPMINRHIWREAPAYLPQFYFIAAAAFVPPVIGALLRVRKLNRNLE